jgi:hypothetical protein
VTLLEFPLLTDENIVPDVVSGLPARGCDLQTTWDEKLIGRLMSMSSSVRTPRVASSSRKIWHLVVASIRTGPSFVGIIDLRTGHVSAGFVLELIDALRASAGPVQPRVIAVTARQQFVVRVRVRTAPPW